jgi:hypothetical protein
VIAVDQLGGRLAYASHGTDVAFVSDVLDVLKELRATPSAGGAAVAGLARRRLVVVRRCQPALHRVRQLGARLGVVLVDHVLSLPSERASDWR